MRLPVTKVINYTAYTLVDVTNSGENRIKNNNTSKYYQQQNFNTLIQSIGIRSQPVNPSIRQIMTQDIVEYGFGKRYLGLHTVWRLDFSIEHTAVFNFKNNDMYHLMNDFDGVAIITGLEETAEIHSRCFETLDPSSINILFNNTTNIL